MSGANSRQTLVVYPLLSMPQLPLARKWLEIDLRALLFVQHVRRRLPVALRAFNDRLISGHPAHDISCAIWLGALIAVWFVGWPLAWMMAGNITLSFLVAYLLPLIAAQLKTVRTLSVHAVGGALEHLQRTPESYDPRLKPRSRVSPNGLPCIEVHLLAVLWTTLFISPATGVGGGAPLSLLGVGCACSWLVLLSLRLYAGTHLLWQLVASALLGLLSAPIQLRLASSAFPRGLDGKYHMLNFLLLAILWVAYVCYQAESNGAPLMRVERAECESENEAWGSIFRGTALHELPRPRYLSALRLRDALVHPCSFEPPTVVVPSRAPTPLPLPALPCDCAPHANLQTCACFKTS